MHPGLSTVLPPLLPTLTFLVVALQFVVPPRGLLAVATFMIAAAAWAVLRPLTRLLPGATVLGQLVPAVAASWGAGRLVSESAAARLAWLLGEEDNAHVVGVARELLAVGPSGSELATQYGTSFVGPGVLALELGVLGERSGDPRLDAVTTVTGSATLLPFIVMTAILIAAAALRSGWHQDEVSLGAPAGRWVDRIVSRATQFLASLLAGTVLQLTIVTAPLQLGFMSLAWAVAWTLAGWAAMLAAAAPGLTIGGRSLLILQSSAALVLLEGSWPFLIGALLLPAIISGGPAALAIVRRRGRGTTTLVLAGGVALLVIGGGIASSGAVRAVFGLGRQAFTAGVEVGSSIVRIGPGLWIGGLACALTVVFVLRRAPHLSLAALGATLGGLLSLSALGLVAIFAADGITGYGGSKLALASLLLTFGALAALIASGRRPVLGLIASAATAVLVLLDPLGRLGLSWWERTSPSEPPHAVATITAIERSDPGLPIRCRPRAGTSATTDAKLAAYFCIVWAEDAFNAERSSGNRFAYFQTQDESFDRVLSESEAEGLYGFAYPLLLGPGWFGWDGTS